MIFGLWFRGDAKGATPLDVKKLTCTRVKFLTSVGLQITARQRGRQKNDAQANLDVKDLTVGVN